MMIAKQVGNIAHRFWSTLAWRQCDMSVTLESGVRLRVRSRSDWDVFLEVFVAGEYDEAIQLALDHAKAASRAATIIDLGANVGFFILRCLDISKRQTTRYGIHLLAVEGSSRIFTELKGRCSANVFDGDLTLFHGLIGRKKGEAYLYESGYACANMVVPNGGRRSKLPFRNAYALPSRYIDVDALVGPEHAIDLIKSDIEGSELEFLQTYPDLLRRVRYLALEIHPHLCSSDSCLQLLTSLGFKMIKIVRQLPTAIHYLFERVPG